jgi:hypothetical protein
MDKVNTPTSLAVKRLELMLTNTEQMRYPSDLGSLPAVRDGHRL